MQGSSFEVGAKVTYEGREMTVSLVHGNYVRMVDVSGILALAAALPEEKSLCSLECATAAASASRMCQPPMTLCLPFAHSIDGAIDPLPIDELKGTKPTEKIDLSKKGFRKGLGVASAIIIASCIKGNGSLKELRCVTSRPHIPQ